MPRLFIVLILLITFIVSCDDATLAVNNNHDSDIIEISDTDSTDDEDAVIPDETEDSDITVDDENDDDFISTDKDEITEDEDLTEDEDIETNDDSADEDADLITDTETDDDPAQDEDTISSDEDTVTPDEDETANDEDQNTELPDNDSFSIADLENLSGQALEKALYEHYEPHTNLGYDTARDRMFNQVDVFDGEIECYYTSRKVTPDGSRTPGGFNTEHSWPQSQLSSAAAKADIHHLFPTDSNANSGRSSYDFGITDEPDDTYCYNNICSERGPSNVSGGTIFEVRPERRGDIARAHFYMAVIYKMDIGSTEETLLRTWNTEDPVDDMEKERNNRIEQYQGNRNPFVDRPDFVNKISDY